MSVPDKLSVCPICRSDQQDFLQALDCGNLDNSKLYPTVRLVCCTGCGHIFNSLSAEELSGLQSYYDEEYAPANMNAIQISGDRPGSSDILTSRRYEQLFDNLRPHIHTDHEILDVGCAMGGLLDCLYEKGYCRLSGCDMSRVYVESARMKGHYKIEQGNAESLPYGDHVYDVVVIEQVLEHLSDPIRAFAEAQRVLRPGGVLCIGVPDAARYKEFYYFDYYWLLLREHIQHFDIDHLRLIAAQKGFELLNSHQTSHAIMSDKMIMPNLCAVFRSSGLQANRQSPDQSNDYGLRGMVQQYLRGENVRRMGRKDSITSLVKSQRPVYAWGVGREFLYLYESVGLKDCNLQGLIDMNPLKQKSALVDGMSIGDDKILEDAPVDSILLITAVAHTDSIIRRAEEIGYRGGIFRFDQP